VWIGTAWARAGIAGVLLRPGLKSWHIREHPLELKESLTLSTKASALFDRIFPYLGSSPSSWCFRITYSLVATGVLALKYAGLQRGQVAYCLMAVCLAAAGWAGQIFPLYPIGIVAFFGLFTLPVVVIWGPY
jgi:hypothetical protein